MIGTRRERSSEYFTPVNDGPSRVTENVSGLQSSLRLTARICDRDQDMLSRSFDADRIAADLLGRDAHRDGPPDLLRLSRRVLGLGAIRVVEPASLPGDAALRLSCGRWIVCVCDGLPPERLRFAVAHEIAEFALIKLRYRSRDIEVVADALAAAMLAPVPGYGRAIAALGDDWAALGRVYEATESLAALRWSEVTGAPLALVTRDRVRVRGDRLVPWPSAHEIRRLARRGGPGIVRRALTDDPARVVLLPTSAA